MSVTHRKVPANEERRDLPHCDLTCVSPEARRRVLPSTIMTSADVTRLRSLAVFAFFTLALALTGCPRRQGTLPTANARELERLRRISAHDMQCDRAQMVMIPLNPSAMETRGCGRIREYSLVCTTRFRCQWQPIIAAAVLAQSELPCTLDAMTVSSPGANSREVSGCGRINRYELICAANLPCRWSRTTTMTIASAPQPPSSYNVTYAAPGPVAPAPQASETTQPASPSNETATPSQP